MFVPRTWHNSSENKYIKESHPVDTTRGEVPRTTDDNYQVPAAK